jgi:hypothetical protein
MPATATPDRLVRGWHRNNAADAPRRDPPIHEGDEGIGETVVARLVAMILPRQDRMPDGTLVYGAGQTGLVPPEGPLMDIAEQGPAASAQHRIGYAASRASMGKEQVPENGREHPQHTERNMNDH